MKGFWRGPNPYGPPPWARRWAAEEETPQPRRGWRWEAMSKAERKAWLEAHKASLEARLAEINEELKKLEEA